MLEESKLEMKILTFTVNATDELGGSHASLDPVALVISSSKKVDGGHVSIRASCFLKGGRN